MGKRKGRRWLDSFPRLLLLSSSSSLQALKGSELMEVLFMKLLPRRATPKSGFDVHPSDPEC